MKGLSRYVRKRERVERIRLVFPAAERDAVWAELQTRGYRLTSTGPYPTGPGLIDASRCLVIAERPITP